MASNTIKFLIEMRDSASGPLKKVGKAAEKSGKDAKGAGNKYTEMASKLTLISAGAAVVKKALVGMFAGSAKFVQVGAQMEGFEARLEVLLGTSKLAKDRLDDPVRA